MISSLYVYHINHNLAKWWLCGISYKNHQKCVVWHQFQNKWSACADHKRLIYSWVMFTLNIILESIVLFESHGNYKLKHKTQLMFQYLSSHTCNLVCCKQKFESKNQSSRLLATAVVPISISSGFRPDSKFKFLLCGCTTPA